MQTFLFRLFGIATLLFGAGIICAFVLTLPRLEADGLVTPKIILRIITMLLLIFGVGIGLFYLRRWAAVILSVGTFVLAGSLIIGTIQGVPFPYSLINYAFGITLFFPIACTIGFWSTLKPGGRFYR